MSVRRDTRRRLEQWLKNPGCEANTLSAVAGVSMAAVAEREGLELTMGQSPFAIARGVTFEASLLRDDAALLREALERARVPVSAGALLDLRLRMNGGKVADQETAWRRTRAWLQAAAAGTETEVLVASATLKVPGRPILLPDGVLAVDALVLGEACRDDDRDDEPLEDARRVLRIGEVKSYPDRGGYTDSGDLAGSRAQASALPPRARAAARRARPGGPAARAPLRLPRAHPPRVGDAVSTGARGPALQSRRARRGFERLRAAAADLKHHDPSDEEALMRAVVGAETDYRPSCLSFCDRAAGCRSAAEACGDAAALGEDVGRFLAGLSIPRSLALLDGAAPDIAAEQEFVQRAARAQGAA